MALDRTSVMKKITLNPSSLRETRWHEYIVRFVFGGLCTATAGIVAKRYGPGVGGLFLAFPAIFPASATMIENSEKRRKAEVSEDGTIRGRLAASIDASGAALGCIGLAAFGLVAWKLLPGRNAYGVITVAVVSWASLSYFLWALRKN
jgi:Protein of unknown function (DUF3147)